MVVGGPLVNWESGGGSWGTSLAPKAQGEGYWQGREDAQWRELGSPTCTSGLCRSHYRVDFPCSFPQVTGK